MYFSDHFNIETSPDQDWFDPILDMDTKLFVDPFQIFKDEREDWKAAHDELINYFHDGFRQLARTLDSVGSLRYRQVESRMTFPEPKEFGLGYVGKGNKGAGTGPGLARLIVKAMKAAIEREMAEDMRHFEELGFLVPRMGPDRISDVTCNVLKPRFIAYTQRIAKSLGVEMAEVVVPGSVFDPSRQRWEPAPHELPINPVNGRGVILVPKRYLRELPTLNGEGFWTYSELSLRDDLSLHVMESVDKEELVRLARLRPDLVRDYVEGQEPRVPHPYDVDRDPEGIYQWDAHARQFVQAHPLPLDDQIESPLTASAVSSLVEGLIQSFRHFVEEQGGWRLLWREDRHEPRREEAIQLLFKGVVQYHCQALGVRLDREVELGRGPVDFLLSSSSKARVLLEVKKLGTDRFWDGLRRQLVSYMTSDDTETGWYLAVQFKDTKVEKQRAAQLAFQTERVARQSGFQLRSALIDARPKLSASKLRENDEV